ncbi:calcium-binding protein [Aquisphaera insulae]|uniref:calcium-binding protein n=1 Tax=Aquisphaera insulae TaxID=2712864 RepID=UPI0013EA52A4|nr:calcium-binding protein [Aquisphaera insulae]
MRILVAIPHYFDAAGSSPESFRHGSLSRDPAPRAAALTACLSALRQTFDGPQVMIDLATRRAVPANHRFVASKLDIVVCTTRGCHLLSGLSIPRDDYMHQPADVEPLLLGFECHAALHERIGDYDYYAYLEDDLVVTDPWFFAKLAWFHDQVGVESLLLPNRYEVASGRVARKAYLDGDLAPEVTAPFQDPTDRPELRSSFLGVDARFVRPLNPHCGGFFLSLDQMRRWALRPDFLDRDCSFIGPLESAASLGMMRTFRVYKPAPEVASFLEIAHHGTGFIDNLRYS